MLPFEQRPHFHRDAAEIGPGDARRGIEIDAELVRMIEIASAHGMGMQFDAAEVHDEGQLGARSREEGCGGRICNSKKYRRSDGTGRYSALGREAVAELSYARGPPEMQAATASRARLTLILQSPIEN